MIKVRFLFFTGIKREIFRNLTLTGSWNDQGRYSDLWSTNIAMQRTQLEDGCPGYVAEVSFDESQVGRRFYWGVRLDTAVQVGLWGIATEENDRYSRERRRSFILTKESAEESYYFTSCRRLGAQKHFSPSTGKTGIRFSVWAPFARNVELVIGRFDPALKGDNTGYISDDGTGIDESVGTRGAFPMQRSTEGVWQTMPSVPFDDFKPWDHKPYMFRVTKEDGQVAYRADLFSRCQIGKGFIDPAGGPYDGRYRDLDGCKSCSIVVDPDTVTSAFEEGIFPEINFEVAERFWQDEFNPERPLPTNLNDLVIYELHVGSLGHGNYRDGNFGDILGRNGSPDFLEYLVDLGVNAIELLPVLQFEGLDHWGYGNSHPYALEYSAGGRDQLKHVIRQCHRHGLAVILDVVFNHYHVDAERAEWAYDSNLPQNNLYYWYEGNPSNYPDWERAARLDPVHTSSSQGGYLDNYSTGYLPRLWEETLRSWFIGGAVALAEEFHVDGFRVDLPQALYQFNVRHADGQPVPWANDFGAKFLRELTRTIRMVRPGCFLIAEDHSDGSWVTQSPDEGGLGFDASWYARYYHHLIGDGNAGMEYARLLYMAGLGDDRALAMDAFAGVLATTGMGKIVYHKDHDEAGNAAGTWRNIVGAVNGAPLISATRTAAEARCRWVAAVTLLSAGTPMFLMGEEIATNNPLPYSNFRGFRDDFPSARAGSGAQMFAFYQDLIALRSNHAALRTRSIEIVHVHNDNRMLAFLRGEGVGQCLVVASLNNRSFLSGYWMTDSRLGGKWREIFNSDASRFGGSNVGNSGQVIASSGSSLNLIVPARGVLVLERVGS